MSFNTNKRMKLKVSIALIILFIISLSDATSQVKKSYTLTLQVLDKETKHKLIGATILYKNNTHTKGSITNELGIAQIENIVGETQIIVSYIGYLSQEYSINILSDRKMKVNLQPNNKLLDEVVVTATESKGVTTASRIDAKAMTHLQPTSFTDLLSLLPGGTTSTPNMGASNLIRLREAPSYNGDFDFSSLGTAFVVDDIPLSNDANLQTIPNSNHKVQNRLSPSSGVDMRGISTDNIESVEIIRGIPSAQYGDVSMGVVKIQRKMSASPLHFRFKADQYSKLFYVGKGIALSSNKVLNLNLDYLDSKIDPRNKYENFKRITSSIRYNQHHYFDNGARFKWSSSIDLSTNIDNIKSDPEIDEDLDQYKMRDIRLAFNNDFTYSTAYEKGLRNITVTPAINTQINDIKQTKEITLNMPKAIPNSTTEGVHDAIYLPMRYISHAKVEGRPVNLFIKLNSNWAAQIGKSKHRIKVGIDYRYDKNYGRGQMYDLTRPPATSLAIRPRRFKDIPGLQKASFFVEDNITIPFYEDRTIDIQAGIRGIALVNMNNKYRLNNKIHLDPRFNLMIDIFHQEIKESTLQWRIGGGWGILTKLPTLGQLYPNLIYTDLEELNYYHTNPDYRRLVLSTHIYDPTNFNLKANRNTKWEVRTDFTWKRYNLAVTYFNEHTSSGFRGLSDVRLFNYKRYDTSGIDSKTITDKPQLEDLPYQEKIFMNTVGYIGNGSDLVKQGIEFQGSTPRFKVINTRVTLSGAWFKTTFNNSLPEWSRPNIIINNQEVPYMGLYDMDEKKVYQTMNTSLMFDTHIPTLGLIFSTTIQAQWINKQRIDPNNTVPYSYMGADKVVHPYTDVEAKDPILKQLIHKERSAMDSSVPFESTINFKANKSFGKHLNISIFVNSLLSYTPSYKRGEITIYRNVPPYFGMELNIKF